MGEIASRDLRNETRGVLARVEAGEAVTITLNGRAVATLQPVRERNRWITRDLFVRRLAQVDSGLTADLAELVPDPTDDLSDS